METEEQTPSWGGGGGTSFLLTPLMFFPTAPSAPSLPVPGLAAMIPSRPAGRQPEGTGEAGGGGSVIKEDGRQGLRALIRSTGTLCSSRVTL